MSRLPIVAVVVAAAGCGGGDLSRAVVHPVTGRIEVSDRPAGDARLAFHPLDSARARGTRPVGISRPDGTFELTTYSAGDGAPEGEYVVTVFWMNEAMPLDECNCPDPLAHDRLFGLYADAATSELRATIRAGSNDVVIRATVGGRGWHLPPLIPHAAAVARPTPPASDSRALTERERADAEARARAERERNGTAGPNRR